MVARPDGSGETRLVAYIVNADGPPLTIGELRAYLEKKLPPYMIPSALVVLDAIPVSTSGKVDRRALPDPLDVRITPSTGYSPPRTRVEQRLAEIWATALGQSKVGIHDNFFELGGHSLMAVGLFSKIEAEFGKAIPLAALFRTQTVVEMAAMLEGSVDSSSQGPTLTLRTGKPDRPPLFLVHGLSGELLYWRPLVERLGNDRSVHGLKLPEKNGEARPFSDLEAMAAHHVEQMCAIQPDGPYHVAGYSFGATVALEIAQQLISKGKQVGLLGTIDSGPYRLIKSEIQFPPPSFLAQHLYYWVIDDLLKTHPRDTLSQVTRKLRSFAPFGRCLRAFIFANLRHSLGHRERVSDGQGSPPLTESCRNQLQGVDGLRG